MWTVAATASLFSSKQAKSLGMIFSLHQINFIIFGLESLSTFSDANLGLSEIF
jgi:hypothetical protein